MKFLSVCLFFGSLVASSSVLAQAWEEDVMSTFMSDEADCRDLPYTEWPTKICYLQPKGERPMKAKFRADEDGRYRLKSLIVCEEGFGKKLICLP